MNKYAIVVIGYNRPVSMQRLLNSLSQGIYGNDKITLIISIDNSGTDEVKKCADIFFWKFGEKKIVVYPKKQGLRQHILHCGDFLYDYDAIAVLEDDIVVAPGFYTYMKETVKKYHDNDQIAGISLYNHLWNVHVNMPFEPVPTIYDTYFFQFAQSWGQIWMKKQWFDFQKWYKQNREEFGEINGVPESVCGWPSSSWLKYHIRYCVEKDKYFVYPYKS
jgi:Glycosyl transferase family 2.